MANGNTNLMGTQFSAPSVDVFGFPISQPEWQDPYGIQAYNQEFNPIDPNAFAPENPNLTRYPVVPLPNPNQPNQPQQRGRMSEASMMGIVGGLGGIAQGLIGRGRRRAEQRERDQEAEEAAELDEDID